MEFTEIKNLYNHLEINAADYKYNHKIANLFQRLRDFKRENGQIDEAEMAQWEIDCFSFGTQNGKLKSMYSGTDDKGRPCEYPDISKLSDSELDYIEGRLESTTNPILKARYANILWESQKKHRKYAKIAVDAYLNLIELYEEKINKDPETHNGLNVLTSIEHASFLAFGVNYRVADIRSEMSRLVKEFNFKNSSAFVMRVRLIEYMLKKKNKFPLQCFDGFPEVCLSLGLMLFNKNRFNGAIDIFQVAEKVDSNLGLKSHNWKRSIAESYEGLMNERDESDLAVMSFCQEAIEHYRKIGDEEKVQELEKRYEFFRGKQQFGMFSQNIDLTEFRNRCKEMAQKLCTEEPENIISVLIADKSLLPRRKDMKKSVEESSKNALLSDIAPVTITDHHGHTAEHFTTEEEKRYYQILHHYAFSLQLEKQILVNEIFIESIKKNKLNIYTVMDFFKKNSWYGKNITKNLPSRKTITYNWLNLIAPSLNDYFLQMQIHFSQPSYAPNFILSMDSLSLKIEGLVRDICIFSDITTFYQTKDKQGQIIVREKDINRLLREKPINSLFDEDDLLFFKFVLIEKAGLNLRNKIAHCLIDYSEYNISYMHLLLLVLFRLGRYDFVKIDETVKEKVADIEY